MIEGTFNAQRSTFKCQPPIVIALRATWRARVANLRAAVGRAGAATAACAWKDLLNKHSASDYFAYARSFLSHYCRGDHVLPAVRASALRSETDSRPVWLTPELDLRG